MSAGFVRCCICWLGWAAFQMSNAASDEAETLVQRGIKAIDAKKYSEALSDLSDAIRLNPHSGLPFEGRAQVYAITRDNDPALADSNEAIRLDPNAAPAYWARSAVYHRRGDDERSIADLDRFLKLRPNAPDVLSP